jgi:cation diffusion facilitator CzcD-associated flavoprotein CzcO
VRVSRIERTGDRLTVVTDVGAWTARAVVSATGTWSAPNVPRFPDQDRFHGRSLHSARYASANEFDGQRSS